MLLVQDKQCHLTVLSPITPLCKVKALLGLTDVQKMQLHSWRVVILSREYSQRHSLQVSRGSRANSPASDSSAVMVWGQAFPAEPIQSLIVHSAWKEKSRAETSHKPCSFSLTWAFTAQIHKSTCTPKYTTSASWCQSHTSGHSKFTK